MIGEREVLLARPLIADFISAVHLEDAKAIQSVYGKIQARFGVDGPQAVAVLCADLIVEEREKARQVRKYLANANAEAARFGEAYLEKKRDVEELREILHQRARSSTAKRKKAA